MTARTRPQIVDLVDTFNATLQSKIKAPGLFGTFRNPENLCDRNQLPEEICRELFGKSLPSPAHADLDVATQGLAEPLDSIVVIGMAPTPSLNGTPQAHKIRDRLVTCMERFRQSAKDLVPNRYHLVTWNFLPYRPSKTLDPAEFSALEQAVVLSQFGYADVLSVAEELIANVAPWLVVFQGVDSAVPHLGMLLAAKIRPDENEHPRVLFCEDLCQPLSRESARTTIEYRPPLRRSYTLRVEQT